MMTEPGITKLDKCVDSRYTLVSMASKRARMIGKAIHDELIDNDGEKPVTTAVKEISSGRVGYVRSEEIRKAKEWEAEKFAAIQHMSESDLDDAEEAANMDKTDIEADDDKEDVKEEDNVSIVDNTDE